MSYLGHWIFLSSYFNFFGVVTMCQDCFLIFRTCMWLAYQVFNKPFWSFYRDGLPFYICKQLVQNILGEGTFCKGQSRFLIFRTFMWLVYQVFSKEFWSFYRDGPPFSICKQLVQNIWGEGTFCKGQSPTSCAKF